MKKRFFCLGLIALVAAFIGCSLDNDDEAASVGAWLSAQGMPENYSVDVVEIHGVPVLSKKVERDTTPISGYTFGAFGKSAGMVRDYVMDFAFDFTKGNKNFISAFRSDTTTESYVRLFPLANFYSALKDSLPFKESLQIKVSWKLEKISTRPLLNKVTEVRDSAWFGEVYAWEPALAFDSTYTWVFDGKTSNMLSLPKTFTTALRDTSMQYGRILMKISAPEASRAYRFIGHGSLQYRPAIRIRTGISAAAKDSSYYLTPFRSAVFSSGTPASETTVYGVTRDSMIIEIDGKIILDSLAAFYNDEFPWNKGNKMDVRQAVVLAQFTVPKDDSQGEAELPLPIQTVTSSFDNAYGEKENRITELYKLDKETIKSTGHPNLVFYDKADSLTLQVTYGMRDFLNRASEVENLKVMLRLGYPVLAPQDTIYGNYIRARGDTVFFFADYLGYAKYDFASAFANGVNMKLWLLSKRGEAK